MVGDSRHVELPDWGRLRAGAGRLRGLRCVHTHLGDPEGPSLSRDDLTDLAALRLDAMMSLGVGENGLPGDLHVAHLGPVRGDGVGIQKLEPTAPEHLDLDFQGFIRALEDELASSGRTRAVSDAERAILVAVSGGRLRSETEDSVAELRELARSADVDAVEVLIQHRSRPDPRTLIGPGRLDDLVILAFRHDVDLVLFDCNLTPVQARNLAERLELRILDRTQLILDIFAQRARSRDGKLQVELAQLRYRLPRLAQRDDGLSRLAGGIGGRGPGEQRLEVDRRRVRSRIARLERGLEKLRRERETRRQRRSRRGVPVLSIVGYTNAGKSTLLRALTHADVPIENKLFATLDPASRRLRFPREREVILTDTVGFIRDLPSELTAAFRATLEELRDADLFLHVADAASPNAEQQIAAVRRILTELDYGEIPELLVFNQIDRLPPGVGEAQAAQAGGVAIAARDGTGLRNLLARVEAMLWDASRSARPRRGEAAT